MAALLDPTNRTRRGFRPWGLVVYIVAMFSVLDPRTGTNMRVWTDIYTGDDWWQLQVY
jgi:hypothetical protein